MIRLSAMQVRFWGTRGSIAAPGPSTARFGGNTSCVEVRASDGTVIILDCGTGARELGLHLAQTMPQPIRLHLFIGHTHWDHIQGFPFFVPAFLPGSELNIYAPIGFQRGLEEAMAGQMEYSYFPVKMRDLRSRIHFTELDEGFFRVGGVLVETQFLNHTAPTIAYRMTSDGATNEFRLIVWGIQIVVGLIGLLLAGKVTIDEAKRSGWRRTPGRVWRLFWRSLSRRFCATRIAGDTILPRPITSRHSCFSV